MEIPPSCSAVHSSSTSPIIEEWQKEEGIATSNLSSRFQWTLQPDYYNWIRRLHND